MGVTNRSASNAEMIPMIAKSPKFPNCRLTDPMKPAKTAEVIMDVVTIATPTTRKVCRMARR